ncbi:beta-ketoacyl-ACP synthase 3 [Thiotrichales bacterium HSG14]|nr:beta-ketoacyl-ACP synthase 3 [Thiotrichales bacterium HSG14]
MTNADIVQRMNMNEDFIVKRTGIVTRHHAKPEQGLYALILPAAKQAVSDAGLSMDAIDMLIINTLSPDHHDPSEACFVQKKLGLNNVPAFDIRAQCSGFIYALDMASQFIATGRCRHILIVCAELLSKRMDYTHDGRNLSILLGDGAGAVVLSAENFTANRTVKLVDIMTGADGDYFNLLYTASPGTHGERFISAENIEQGETEFRLQGKQMFQHATETLVAITKEICRRHDLVISDFDTIIAHQPNLRILDVVRDELNIPLEKMPINADRFGNMASASLPVTFAQAWEEDRFQNGGRHLILGYGSGVTWGAAIVMS